MTSETDSRPGLCTRPFSETRKAEVYPGLPLSSIGLCAWWMVGASVIAGVCSELARPGWVPRKARCLKIPVSFPQSCWSLGRREKGGDNHWYVYYLLCSVKCNFYFSGHGNICISWERMKISTDWKEKKQPLRWSRLGEKRQIKPATKLIGSISSCSSCKML